MPFAKSHPLLLLFTALLYTALILFRRRCSYWKIPPRAGFLPLPRPFCGSSLVSGFPVSS